MKHLKLSTAPTHIKFFITTLLCIIGLVYITLLVTVFIDTEFKPSFIREAYGDMEYIEISQIVHNALPFYALFLFAIPVFLFMFTSYSEKAKRFMAVFPFVIILFDVGSMYLIPYVSKGFSYVLWLAGLFLAVTFLALFIMIQYDLWLKKQNTS
jgi:uncharacterized membrane protein